jgi:tetratricopeptide (TPR) repeat protein
MKFIRELYSALLSGRHQGKAIKLSKRGQYQEALNRYKLALFYEGKNGTGPNPATLECLARTYARLGNLKEALAAATESYNLYRRLDSKNKLIEASIIRVEGFITALKSENMDGINKTLTI